MAVKKVRRAGEEFNDSNHPQLAPFWCDPNSDVLQVEAEQYDAWAITDCLGLLETQFESVARSEAPVPRLDDVDLGSCPAWFFKVYDTVMERANVGRWAHLIHASILPIQDETSQQLLTEVLNAHNTGIPLLKQPTCLQLAQALQEIMDAVPKEVWPDGWFVKCGACPIK